jgi:hypothetical protein
LGLVPVVDTTAVGRDAAELDRSGTLACLSVEFVPDPDTMTVTPSAVVGWWSTAG